MTGDSDGTLDERERRGMAAHAHEYEACPGCGCMPGDGLTPGCDDPGGCGFWRAAARDGGDDGAEA